MQTFPILKVATRIELSGRLTRKPEMRVTPAGTRYLRLEADCGDASSHLPLEIIMSGDGVAELARQFHQEDQIQASGSLRARVGELRRAGSIGIEVIADKITLVEKNNTGEQPSRTTPANES